MSHVEEFERIHGCHVGQKFHGLKIILNMLGQVEKVHPGNIQLKWVHGTYVWQELNIFQIILDLPRYVFEPHVIR
ncbi:hypothetical protein, partial [Klebsiella aerogenes]|uniref:hypothetical protein n=1 Tax=Klebsiella aerogenes TaxID=548 RepID=UPI001CC49672